MNIFRASGELFRSFREKIAGAFGTSVTRKAPEEKIPVQEYQFEEMCTYCAQPSDALTPYLYEESHSVVYFCPECWDRHASFRGGSGRELQHGRPTSDAGGCALCRSNAASIQRIYCYVCKNYYDYCDECIAYHERSHRAYYELMKRDSSYFERVYGRPGGVWRKRTYFGRGLDQDQYFYQWNNPVDITPDLLDPFRRKEAK